MQPERDELTFERLHLKVDTQQQAVVFMPKDCHVCRSAAVLPELSTLKTQSIPYYGCRAETHRQCRNHG
jgi:hypothetical protein